jgi:hypothetical protein
MSSKEHRGKIEQVPVYSKSIYPTSSPQTLCIPLSECADPFVIISNATNKRRSKIKIMSIALITTPKTSSTAMAQAS